MTYYGRWTYKYEMGQQKGAAGVLVVHETGPAGYGFNVVQGKTEEQFDLVTPDKNMTRPAIEAWITLDKARALLTLAGQDFDALKKQAATRDFKPVPLGVTASMTIHNTLRSLDSRNVIARLESSDPQLRDQYVVYTAHWDHFGKTADLMLTTAPKTMRWGARRSSRWRLHSRRRRRRPNAASFSSP